MPTHAQRLIYAVRTQNYDRLKGLLASDGDVDARSAAKRTALHAAAEEGREVAVRLLIEAGADVNVRDQCQQTPLHKAASHGRFMFEDLDSDRKDCLNPYQPTNPEVAAALITIMAEGNPRIPKTLTATERLSEEIKEDVFIGLLDMLAEPKRLEEAFASQDIDIAKLDPDFADFLRGQPRFSRVAEMLISAGADVEARDEWDETPVQVAASIGDVRLLRILLKNGASLQPEVTDDEGDSNPLLKSALDSGPTEVLDLLWEHEIRPDLNDPWPLISSAANCRTKILGWLLDHGMDVNLRDSRGETALIAAGGHFEVMQLLLNRGADVQAVNHNGQTALHSAAAWPKCVALLLPYRLPMDAKDAKGNTPLHITSLSGDPDAIQQIINAGASLNSQNDSGNTALHEIFFSDEFRPDVEFPGFLCLVAAGIDRAIQNNEGKTAYDLAVEYSYPEEYLALLKPDLTRPASDFVYIGSHKYRPFLPDSQVEINIHGVIWASCGHYFHASKVQENEAREIIRQAPTSGDANCRARENGTPTQGWLGKKWTIMRACLLAKFQQHPTLREALLATGTATLVTDSNCENFWIEGSVRFNAIGAMLMEIRQHLREHSPEEISEFPA